MILFDFFCPACFRQEERVVPYDERNNQKCILCNLPMDRLFTQSALYDGGYERRRFPYYDESLDKFVRSSQEKKKILKEKNLIQHDGFFSRGGGSNREKIGVIYSIPKGE